MTTITASTTAATITDPTTRTPNPSSIIIRDAYYRELPAIARVMSLAFWDDHIFGGIIHPFREKYPLDSDLYWLRRARVNYWDYRYKWLVAIEQDPVDTGREKVVAIVQWERLGEGGKQLECACFDPRNLLRPLSSIAMKVHEKIWPNRAASPLNEDVIERSYPCFRDIWSGERGETWYLAFLAVHPDYQGCGLGKKLTRWGLDRAEEDGVRACVISALGKDDFYKKCGFEEQFGSGRDGENNPLADTEGSDMFWKWPGKRAV